jgi:hypothetical protein
MLLPFDWFLKTCFWITSCLPTIHTVNPTNGPRCRVAFRPYWQLDRARKLSNRRSAISVESDLPTNLTLFLAQILRNMGKAHAIRRGSSNQRAVAAPKIKPPICAKYATPPVCTCATAPAWNS